ncbi:hypothetical protein [Nocardioides dongkuii]|uniref:hypothetical protein n=1 Tax=Nocardioides dongkuii TaxID=2760089 RepID=UPI0015F7EFBC|nr:hypothetical protein [Nocardioides dongkuii]
MTRDRETAEAELVWGTAQRLWEETGAPVTDTTIAHESGIELATVREWLDQAALRLEVTRDGESRTVLAPVR